MILKSSLQKYMLLQSIQNSEDILYVTQVEVTISGVLQKEKLSEAILKTINQEKYSSLSYVIKKGQLCFKLIDQIPIETAIIENPTELNQLIDRDFHTGTFEENELLFRFKLIYFKDTTTILFSHSHALLDANNFYKLFLEILNIYSDNEITLIPTPLNKPSKNTIENNEMCRWIERIRSIEKITRLPGEKNSEERASFREKEFSFTKTICEKLKALSSHYKVSYSTIFNFLWAFTVSHYTHQKDISFVTTRRKEENEKNSNLSFEIIPVIAELTSDSKIKESLESIAKQLHIGSEIINSSDIKWQEQLDKNIKHGFYKSLLDYKSISLFDYLANNSMLPIIKASFRVKTDYIIVSEFFKENELFFAKISYWDGILTSSCVSSIMNFLTKLVSTLVPDDKIKISDLKLITSIPIPTYPRRSYALPYKSLLDMIFNKIEAHYKHIAIKDEFTTLTYKDLETIVCILSQLFSENGINFNDRIIVSCGRSYEHVASILALQSLGAVPIPLEDSIPEERVKKCVSMCNVKKIILNHSSWPQLEDIQLNLRKLSMPNSIGKKIIPSKINELAFIIFTSGTSGSPKAVKLTQSGIINSIENIRQLISFSNHDRLLCVASLSFDMAIMDIMLPLCNYATLVIASEHLKHTPKALCDLIVKEKISVIEAPPTLLRAISQIQFYPTVKLKILSGGEVLSSKLANKLLDLGQVWNLYGPTENSIYTTAYKVVKNKPISLGKILPNQNAIVMSHLLQPVGLEGIGELWLSGIGTTPGYEFAPNQERFINYIGKTWYKTGDLVRLNGEYLDFIGRLDDEVKINGFLINLSEIETLLLEQPYISSAALLVENSEEQKEIHAYICIENQANANNNLINMIRDIILESLPYYMVPKVIHLVSKIPSNQNGKVDKNKIKEFILSIQTDISLTDDSSLETIILSIWKNVLNTKEITHDSHFFQMGGDSFTSFELLAQLKKSFPEVDLSIIDIYKYPTFSSFTHFLKSKFQPVNINKTKKSCKRSIDNYEPIAIISMSIRAPDSKTTEEFWENIQQKNVCIHKGDSIEENFKQGTTSNFVISKIDIKDNLKIDSQFFKLTEDQINLLTPEKKVLLKLCWEAFEKAGLLPNANHQIGIVAASSDIERDNVHSNISPLKRAKSNDFIASHLAFLLNLSGEAVTVNTACSSGLTAIIKACESLQSHRSDVMLACAVSLDSICQDGYFYHEGFIFSKSGNCRPFDKFADGTVPSSGAGVVLLKRLSDAIKDKNPIQAVIAGKAINNDGSDKAHYLAPSLSGQVDCLTSALSERNIISNQVAYIETHGTGTKIGDSIEIEALTNVYGKCAHKIALGSLKANFGHTDIASGMLGAIKAALIVKNGIIPPQANFTELSPYIDFKNNCFFIPTKESHIPKTSFYVAISSFGVGGTNTHLILQGPPKAKPRDSFDISIPILLTADSQEALKDIKAQLNSFFQHNSPSLEDIAYTLLFGRVILSVSELFYCESIPDLLENLEFSHKKITIEKVRVIQQRFKDILKDAYFISLPTYPWQSINTKSAHSESLTHSLLLKFLSHNNINDDLVIDSLQAIELSYFFKNKLSVTIPPSKLLEINSSSELLGLINYQSKEDLTKDYYLLRKGKTSKTLFLIHPVGGTAFCYKPLSELIKPEFTIYAFQDPDIHNAIPTFNSLQNLASHYLTQIQKIQPNGPYYLAGQSLGGVLAIEIARQFTLIGEPIQYIGLIETWAIIPDTFRDKNIFKLIMEKQHQLLHEKLEKIEGIPKEPWLNLQWNRMSQLYNYSHSKIDFKVYLYKARDLNESYYPINSSSNHWDNYISQLTIHQVSGNHETILYDKNVKELASFMNRDLEKH